MLWIAGFEPIKEEELGWLVEALIRIRDGERLKGRII